MMFAVLVGLTLQRMLLAFEVLWTVARKSEIRGRLPWRHFGRLMVSDLPVAFRLIGLAGVLVIWPAAALSAESRNSNLLLLLALAMFAAGAATPRALHRSRDAGETQLSPLKRITG